MQGLDSTRSAGGRITLTSERQRDVMCTHAVGEPWWQAPGQCPAVPVTKEKEQRGQRGQGQGLKKKMLNEEPVSWGNPRRGGFAQGDSSSRVRCRRCAEVQWGG